MFGREFVRENAGLPKLRGELQRLQDAWKAVDKAQPAELAQLRAENEQLQEQKRDLQELPNRATCIHNLELIDAAKSQFAQTNGLITGEPVSMDEIASYFPNGVPTCPDGGHYNINRVGAPPACSISGHSIP